MGHGNVSRPAAVICDIYGTLLDFGPGPGDPEARWRELYHEFFPGLPAPALTLNGLEAAVMELVQTELRAGRARGAVQPEVDWPVLAARVLPVIDQLDTRAREAFFLRHGRLFRTTYLMPGAAEFLQTVASSGARLGIASNAQAPTRVELVNALADAGVPADCFEPALCFYSFEHGFAKPDPRVFAWLSLRLAERGIDRASALMVGDSVDNDIAPAAAAGWRTWLLRSHGPPGQAQGGWPALLDAWISESPGPPPSPGLAK